MLYHQLEWDLDGVLQWREGTIQQERDVAYHATAHHTRWRLPFLFCQMPVSYADLDTDPQTIAQAESVIQFLANFGRETRRHSWRLSRRRGEDAPASAKTAR